MEVAGQYPSAGGGKKCPLPCLDRYNDLHHHQLFLASQLTQGQRWCRGQCQGELKKLEPWSPCGFEEEEEERVEMCVCVTGLGCVYSIIHPTQETAR